MCRRIFPKKFSSHLLFAFQVSCTHTEPKVFSLSSLSQVIIEPSLEALEHHDRQPVDAHEDEEQHGEEDQAEQVEARHHLVLARHLERGRRGTVLARAGARAVAAGAGAVAARAPDGGGGQGHDHGVGAALLEGVDLEAQQDDGVLEEGAEHEEDAGDDPSLERENRFT